MAGYKCIFAIGDLHIPYHHPDTYAFLKLISQTYSIDKVVLIGDEVDYHSISFHPSSPELLGASDELEAAIRYLKPIYELFPKAHIIDSNHGSLVYRRGSFHGLPRSMFRTYNEILEAPKDWQWADDLTIPMSNGQDVYFHHGKTSAYQKLSKNMSMCAVQGHYHAKFEVSYWGNPNGLFWDLRVGCLINNKSLAFAYNKTTMDRPIIGSAIIINGHPRLLPMVLNKDGRWIKELV